jgi:hypothetical protein
MRMKSIADPCREASFGLQLIFWCLEPSMLKYRAIVDVPARQVAEFWKTGLSSRSRQGEPAGRVPEGSAVLWLLFPNLHVKRSCLGRLYDGVRYHHWGLAYFHLVHAAKKVASINDPHVVVGGYQWLSRSWLYPDTRDAYYYL